MASKIKIKRSAVAGKVPLTTDLELSELAVNTNDGRLYTKKDDGTESIVEIGGPDFGSRNVTTTGTSTAASFIPSSSTVPTNGVYLPAANSVAISTGGAGRLFVDANGNIGLGTSSATNFANYQTLTLNDTTGSFVEFKVGGTATHGIVADSTSLLVKSIANLPVVFGVNDTERMRLTSTGLGIGNSSPEGKLTITGTAAEPPSSGTTANSLLQLTSGLGNELNIGLHTATGNYGAYIQASDNNLAVPYSLHLQPRGGNVGIGTSTPSQPLHVLGAGTVARLDSSSTATLLRFSNSSNALGYIGYESSNLTFYVNDSERFRCDSSGRLLVGTSSSIAVGVINSKSQIEFTDYDASQTIKRNSNGDGGPQTIYVKSRGTSNGSNTVVQNGDSMGQFRFYGTDGTSPVEGASINAVVDGTPGANDMPGRLVFSTTADGASSPTERMRISSLGELRFGVENPTSSSYVFVKTDSNTCYIADRINSDGDLFLFRQAGTQEGSISVSGTTVSYNGAHLSRWSQLPGGVERTEILRGTVLSNIDEMCEWGDEDNEQLNRMKVSDVEGDKNVSGVFQAWDDDDDTYTNDFYCAMTGDFIIRIAQGVTVARGDLLMSAGDGTAKPQDDDIIRSKTIAKVTSTNVSCTYDDGSYCVPCVLMAC